tara:strand:+ start:605 stop:1234 length:630 start_codon:yes stop_codon:yes gene_type:complete
MNHLDFSTLKTYWINLDDRTDRQDSMIKLFDKLGIRNTERVSAIKAEPYYYGCGMSHIKTLERGLESGTPFLVLEDDVNSNSTFKPTLDVSDKVDAVYLGWTTWSATKERSSSSRMTRELDARTFDDNFVKVSYMTSLHAVLYLSEEYARKCIDSMKEWVEEKKWHCDVATAEVQHDFNVVVPVGRSWFYQDDPRNISWTDVEMGETIQ